MYALSWSLYAHNVFLGSKLRLCINEKVRWTSSDDTTLVDDYKHTGEHDEIYVQSRNEFISRD